MALKKRKKQWPHLRIRKSSIEGKGLFTSKAIRKGQFIGKMRGPKVTRDGHHVLWLEQDDGTDYPIQVRGPLKYINHSSRSNVELDDHPTAPAVYAKRRIQAGEELTWHYGENPPQ